VNAHIVAEASSAGSWFAALVLCTNPTRWWIFARRMLASVAVTAQGWTSDEFNCTSSLSATHVLCFLLIFSCLLS